MKATQRVLPWSALCLVLTVGCTVGPDYVPPEMPVGQGWTVTTGSALSMDDGGSGTPRNEFPMPEDAGRWWQVLGDAELNRLMETALTQNLDLQSVEARIREATATRDRVLGGKRPTGEADVRVEERRQSENGSLPINRIPDLERDQTVVDLGANLSWEPDIVGRTRRALEAAEARLEATEAERRAARLAISTEVAITYLSLRAGQRELDAAEGALRSAQRTSELISIRVEAGEDPAVERWRIKGEVRRLEARLPVLRANLRSYALALGLLTGGLPEAELAVLESPLPSLDLAHLPLSERADILRRRADVAIAERQLAAATADIGLATAELYPRVSIGARGGFQALDGTNLLEASSVTWSILPSISWRFLDGGRVKADIRLAEARAEAAALTWESTVLLALSEAETALFRYRSDLQALELEEAALEAARITRDLEQRRHAAGDVSLLVLLDAERQLEEMQVTVASTQGRASVGLVTLIQALGGGWG